MQNDAMMPVWNQYFVSALWAGLASPISLFSSNPGYVYYVSALSVPQSFAQVGAQIGAAMNRYRDGTAAESTERAQ